MSNSINFHYLKGVLLVASAGFLWSMGGALIKWVSLDSVQVAFWRSLFAFITLLVIIRPKKISMEKNNLYASIAYAFTLLFFVIGTKMTTAANAIFLQYTAPLYIVGLSFFLFKERFRYKEIWTMLFCVVGITLFFSDRVSFEGYVGMLWSLASGVTYASFIVFSKKRSRGHYSEPVVVATFISTIMCGVIVAWDGGFSLAGFAMGWEDSLVLVFLGVFQIGLPCFLYMKGLQAVSSLEAGLISMVEPIFNPVWALLLIAEVPSINTLMGGGVILLAIFFHTWHSYTRSRKLYSDNEG